MAGWVAGRNPRCPKCHSYDVEEVDDETRKGYVCNNCGFERLVKPEN
jgi:DNA-directed RNA polymerase subunit RPC12/RpoP